MGWLAWKGMAGAHEPAREPKVLMRTDVHDGRLAVHLHTSVAPSQSIFSIPEPKAVARQLTWLSMVGPSLGPWITSASAATYHHYSHLYS